MARIFPLQSLNFDVDLAPINTDIMTEDIRKMYKELGVNYRGTLIFGDTVRRPWSLQFDRNFLYERAININEYTIDIVKKYDSFTTDSRSLNFSHPIT